MGKKIKHHTIEDFRFRGDDEFCMYAGFAKVIALNLRTLREKAPGVPSDLCFQHKTDDMNDMDTKLGEKRWRKMLDKMIWVFDEIAADNPNEPSCFGKDGKPCKAYKKYWKKINKGLDLFRDRFFDFVMY